MYFVSIVLFKKEREKVVSITFYFIFSVMGRKKTVSKIL